MESLQQDTSSVTPENPSRQQQRALRSRSNSLILAAKQGDFSTLQSIIHNLRTQQVVRQDNDEETCCKDLEDSSSLKIPSSLSVDRETDDRKEVGGSTALLWACASGSVPCVELLLQNGANIRHTSKIGWTALICAAQDGYEQVVKCLLNHDSTMINHKDVYGNTALHWACFNAYYKVVQCLLEFGADATEKNHFGQIPENCIGKDRQQKKVVNESDKEMCMIILKQFSSSVERVSGVLSVQPLNKASEQ